MTGGVVQPGNSPAVIAMSVEKCHTELVAREHVGLGRRRHPRAVGARSPTESFVCSHPSYFVTSVANVAFANCSDASVDKPWPRRP